MTNKLYQLSLTVIASLLLSACGSSGTSGTSVASSPSNHNNLPTPEPEPEPQAEINLLLAADSTVNTVENSIRSLVQSTQPKVNLEFDYSDSAFTPNEPLLSQANPGQFGYIADLSYTAPEGEEGILGGNLYLYRQDQSAIIFSDNYYSSGFFADKVPDDTLQLEGIIGEATKQLPNLATSVNYTGRVFTYDDMGNLQYDVNFTTKQGHGSLYSFVDGTPDLTLNTLNLQDKVDFNGYQSAGGLKGSVSLANSNTELEGLEYNVIFLGKNAEELAGNVVSHKDYDWLKSGGEAVFSGAR